MEQTVEQAFQQGVAAHKKENFQEAERLYRTVLQSQPLHSDANHNLGVLAVLFNKTDAALPLFKTALEANPQIEQFWFSYVDALIKEKQFYNAKKVLEQAKYYALAGEKLNALEAQLTALNIEESSDSVIPPRHLLRSLLRHYEAGRLADAEKLALSITHEFPKHEFGWKVLGVVLGKLGRNSQAVNANQKAVTLSPQDAEAHNNLGVPLKDLGRLEEAKESFMQAIALKSDYAEALSNLGNTLKELGRFDEAEVSCIKAIALKPDLPKAHECLLQCLYQLDKRSVFFDELDYLINQDNPSAVIGSMTSRSALKYGPKKRNIFCMDPLKYVSHTDLNTHYDFKEIFVREIKSILDKKEISKRNQLLLVNGYQTSGNLFDIENSFIEKIQKAIRLEIEKYRIKFKNSEEGLIKKWPTEYSLYGWLVSMKSGGELYPHIHERGWISGSVYINVPPKSKARSGNLVVSLGKEKDTTDIRLNVKKTISVLTGSLVLFPASLMHYTIPFESEEERIVLAFDVRKSDSTNKLS
jgi:Flp pilus assembly protein TadD